MDEHLAGCDTCCEVFAETARFVLDEARAEAPRQPRPAFVRGPARPLLAALAAAAALLVAGQFWPRGTSERPAYSRAGNSSLVAELADAVGDRRFIEPRLTGGFRHGRLVVPRSDAPFAGLDAQTPAVIAAVARIRAHVEGDSSAEATGALGVTYLVSGDVLAAVKALESATQQDPSSARLQSDLAAAYLVRASRRDEPADFSKALEAAEKAIALASPPDEAWFNRALALERLHLVDAAKQAWQDYLQRDPTSGWAEEARRHLEQLPAPPRSSAEEEPSVRAALADEPTALDRLATLPPSSLRDHFRGVLLPAWAEAKLHDQGDVSQRAREARLVGEVLLRLTGDALPRDTAHALLTRNGTELRSQAKGLQALQDAQRLNERMEPSCDPHRMALRQLEAGGSPLAAWARLQVVITCLFASDQRGAAAELGRIETVATSRGYAQLLGRTRWMQGLIGVEAGDPGAAVERYRLAHRSFVDIREPESEAATLALIAQGLSAMGDESRAWRERVRALSMLGQVRSAHRRQAVLDEAVHASLAARTPRSGLHFEDALVAATMQWSAANATSEALMRRAQLRHALGSHELAAADLRSSLDFASRVSDPVLKQRLTAQAEATSGELLERTDPGEAVRALRASAAHFRATAPQRIPSLQLLLGRALAKQGQTTAAERELLTGIEELERQRTTLRDLRLQVSFFDQGLPLYDDMVRLKAARGDVEGALAFAERGRSRQLLDALRRRGLTPVTARAPSASLDVRGLQAGLDTGVLLVYYGAFEDRLLAWTVTRTEVRLVTRPLPAERLRRLVARHRASLEPHASRDAARRTGAALHDELVGPLESALQVARTIVFVPDATLQGVPFASLLDSGTGRYLVEDHVIGVAPSGSVFVLASQAASARGPGGPALIFGNPRFDRELHAGLPDLPGAEAEATEIAGLYQGAQLFTGARATRKEFLDRVADSSVVHYAGHAVASASEESGRLLLAPDGATVSGMLDLGDLGLRSAMRTRLVVLAACRTAAGSVSLTEGALSLARPFLAAGAPNVVAGLWDIDDAVSRRFFVEFHRAFLAEGEPLAALRRAQATLLASDEAALAHASSWAGFVCLGGLDRRHAAILIPIAN
jgi:CHAT domain-containing protein/tetratricopeptide (TPR) repeat protein